MRIDPNRLLILDAVATAGSITAAARNLHLVPSGVSQHLIALEREVGVNLVDRSRRGGRRGVALTSAGRRLAADAALIRARLDQVELDIARWTDTVQGELTVAAFPTVLGRLVLPAREHVMAAHDAVQVRVVELDEAAARSAIHAGRLDVAIVEQESGHRGACAGLAGTPLLDDRYLVALPLAWPVPNTLAELGDRPWIEGPPRSVTASMMHRHRRAEAAPFLAAHACLEYPAVLDLVEAGLGAALVPELALRNIAPRRVRTLDLPGLGARSIHAIYLQQRRERPVVRAFLDSLQAAARDLEAPQRSC